MWGYFLKMAFKHEKSSFFKMEKKKKENLRIISSKCIFETSMKVGDLCFAKMKNKSLKTIEMISKISADFHRFSKKK